MAQLSEMSGLRAASVDLLQAAGIRDVEHLADQDPDFLTDELKKANDALSIVERPPASATVEKWISSAEIYVLAQTEELSVEFKKIADNEEIPKETPIEDIASSHVPNRNTGNLDARIGELKGPKTNVPPTRESPISALILNREQQNFDASRIRTSNPKPDSKQRKSARSKNSDLGDRVDLIRAPRDKTNQGKSPHSRRFVRGVLHTHPWSLRIGAASAMLIMLNLPLAAISTALLLLSREKPETFGWVGQWILIFPVALPLVALIYVVWGLPGRCRICTRQLFVHQRALKHSKSHRFPGMGFVVPLSLHLLLFSWFRCSSCGTPVSLKK